MKESGSLIKQVHHDVKKSQHGLALFTHFTKL